MYGHFVRAHQTFQGEILMAERGMIPNARILLRSVSRTAFRRRRFAEAQDLWNKTEAKYGVWREKLSRRSGCGAGALVRKARGARAANLDTPPSKIIYLNGLQMVDDPLGGSVRASQARSTIDTRYRPVMEEKDAEYFQSLPRRHQDQRSRRDSSFLYRSAGSA